MKRTIVKFIIFILILTPITIKAESIELEQDKYVGKEPTNNTNPNNQEEIITTGEEPINNENIISENSMEEIEINGSEIIDNDNNTTIEPTIGDLQEIEEENKGYDDSQLPPEEIIVNEINAPQITTEEAEKVELHLTTEVKVLLGIVYITLAGIALLIGINALKVYRYAQSQVKEEEPETNEIIVN